MSSGYNRKDHLYERAKTEGYRSRAAYKLIEIDKRYKLFKPGLRVLDLGAWPGGWLQIASERIGDTGIVIGVDLVKIDELSSSVVHLIQGDACSPEVQSEAKTLAGGKFDLVLSDMSPKLTGIKEVDRSQAIGVAELALAVAQDLLRPGGGLVIKVFKSQESEMFFRSLKKLFNQVVRSELDATRKTSNEFYLIALGFKKWSIADA